MAGGSGWVPQGIDVERSSAARTHDYPIGGGHDTAAGREPGDRLPAVMSGTRDMVRL